MYPRQSSHVYRVSLVTLIRLFRTQASSILNLAQSIPRGSAQNRVQTDAVLATFKRFIFLCNYRLVITQAY